MQKKSKRIAVVYVLAFCVVLFNLVFFLKDQLFFTMNGLPEGEFIYASLSPKSDRSVNFYRVDTPEGPAARIELLTLNEKMETEKAENIYWAVGKSVVTIGWIDDDIITVDGEPFDVSAGDSFDSRRKSSFSQKW